MSLDMSLDISVCLYLDISLTADAAWVKAFTERFISSFGGGTKPIIVWLDGVHSATLAVPIV